MIGIILLSPIIIIVAIGLTIILAIIELLRWQLCNEGKRKGIIENHQGYRVIITGASAGIGKALALQYAHKGARLLLAARRAELLEELKQQCLAAGSPQVEVCPTDVTSQQQCQRLLQTGEQLWGGALDLLVLNAGRGAIVEVAKMEPQALPAVMELNVYGCVYAAYYALPSLRRARGSILVVSSLAGIGWTPMRAVYSASKHALFGFFNCLRLEEPEISVSIAYPGYVQTEIHDLAITEKGVRLQRQLDHFMSAEECARRLIHGVDHRVRDIHTEPLKGRLSRWLGALVPEIVDWQVSRIAGIKKIRTE